MMSGAHGEAAAVPADAFSTASPVLSLPTSFYTVAHPVTAAVTSLQGLLSGLGQLEAQFRQSGEAVGSAAHLPTAAGSPSSASAPLLATLDALASATARIDVEVGQQLTSLRRCVAALTQELHSLSDRYPSLQSSGNVNSVTAGASAASQSRTPHMSPSVTTPNSVRAGNGAAPVTDTSPASPPQRPPVVTPTPSPQLQAHTGSFGGCVEGNDRSAAANFGGSLRSPASLTASSSTTTSAKPPMRTPNTNNTTAAAAATAATVGSTTPGCFVASTRPLRSPGRAKAKTPSTAQLTAAASPASPSSPASPALICLFDRVDLSRLPTAQLPGPACAESVKRYLANCVEWPPRPRRRNVRPFHSHHCNGDGLAGRHADLERGSKDHCDDRGESPAWSVSGDDGAGDYDGNCGSHNEEEEDGFHTPATAASRQERGNGSGGCGNGDRAASLAENRRRVRSDVDEFLRRLMEESPYDMSMLRTASSSSDTANNQHSHAFHPNESNNSNGSGHPQQRSHPHHHGSSSSADEEQTRPPRCLSAVGCAGPPRNAVGCGVGGAGPKGKRMRSCQDHEPHSSGARRGLRRGRPTLVESIDALVLSQLRSDGVALTDEMMRELRGCAPADSTAEELGAKVRDANTAHALVSAQTTNEKNGTDAEMVPMAAVPRASKRAGSKEDAATVTQDRGVANAVDFAKVLQEIRGVVRNGGSTAVQDPVTSFPAAPPSQRQQNGKPAKMKALPPSLSLPSRLPTTAAWLAQLDDFCLLLDEIASNSDSDNNSDSSRDENSHGEDGRCDEEEEGVKATSSRSCHHGSGGNGHGGRHTWHSHTSTTSATRERMSRRGHSRLSTRASSSSDTATAASEDDFSVAGELFSSAEEAEEVEEHDVTRDAMATFSIASAPDMASSMTAAAAAAGLSATTPVSRDITHISAFGDASLQQDDSAAGSVEPAMVEGLIVRVLGGTESERGSHGEDTSRGATADLNTESGAGQRARLHSSPSRLSRVSQRAFSNAAPAAVATHTPAASAVARHNPRQERQRGRRRPTAPGSFLRERHLYLLSQAATGTPAESAQSHSCSSAPAQGKVDRKTARQKGATGRQRDGAAGLTSAPLMNCRAAAREVRALSALMRTDLILLATLQELSRLLAAGAGAGVGASGFGPDQYTSDGTAASPAMVECPPTKSSLPESFKAATELLLSAQEKRAIQTRIQAELNLRGVTRSEYESASMAPARSATSPAARSNAMTSLLLSSQHPVSALGYAPLFARFLSPDAAHHNGNSSSSGGGSGHYNGQGAEETASQLAQYIVTVTPYLLAWPSRCTEELPATRTKNNLSASPLLPLPVWLYIETVTTELVEEARKLNAVYELLVKLFAEATLAGVDDGIGECLLRHICCGGRAACALANTGHAGTRLSVDNTLEKFVVPVSVHLLRSFDRLESRHLLHSIFHEVHLSDVVARRRAQQQLSTSSPSPNLRPPPHPITRQPRRSGHASDSGAGHEEEEEEEEEVLGSFTLPPGTLSSSPALRSAAGVQWSMRDAEQQRSNTTPQRGSGTANRRSDSEETAHGYGDEEEPQRRQAESGNAGTPNANRRGQRAVTTRLISTGSDSRHVIIEGFVRYLTSGVERLRGGRAGGRTRQDDSQNRNSNEHGGSDGGNSPSLKTSPQHPPHPHHHSGLTLDVPHTSSLLKELDGRMEKATSNLAIFRSVEADLVTQALIEDALGMRGGLDAYARLRAADVSRRRYFNAHAAVFVVTQPPHAPSDYVPPDTTYTCVVHCRWQPVFQSTLCYCPVTRRRCLDPLVCGALLIFSSLSPQEILCPACELDNPPYNSSHANNNNNSNGGGGGGGAGAVASRAPPNAGAPPSSSGSSPLPFPVTIRALRSGLERAMAVRNAVGGGLPTPGPSVRRAETAAAAREVTASPPQAPVTATTRLDTTTAPSNAWLPSPPSVVWPPPISLLLSSSSFRPPAVLPERVAVPRILAQIPTTLYADSGVVVGGEGRDNGSNDRAENNQADDGSSSSREDSPSGEARRWLLRRRGLRVVPLPLETPPVTRNLLPSPDASQARWLNPPTLLECGHVVSHRTYLDLRTNARRTTRAVAAAAPTTMVVCCPYCSKITAAKDALTLSYLY